MYECSRCWNAHYCSKECQKSHFSAHKKNCRSATEWREQAHAAGVENLSDMFSSWRKKVEIYIYLLARMVMASKQFKMQPPNFVVSLNVDFNYNYGTFLPLSGQPSIQMLDDLSAELRATLQEVLENAIRDKKRVANVDDRENISHVVFVSWRGIHAIMPASMHPSIAKTANKLSRDQMCKVFKADTRKVSSSFYNVDQYRNLQLQNTKLQINAVRQTEAFGHFTHHAFRLYSREPRHKTHAIVLFFDFDFALGRVHHFTRYAAKSLDEMKACIQSSGTQSEMEKHQLISNYLDV
jgi:hypothetical protein